MLKKLIRSNDSVYLFIRKCLMIYVKVRYGLKNVALSCRIATPQLISKDFTLGEYSLVDQYTHICSSVRAGKYVMIATNVTIAGADHLYDQVGTPMCFSGRPEMPETIIGDDVWIGTNVSIRAGVTIGRGAIIGMGSLVLKDVEPYTVVGGVPAQVLKKRFIDEEIKKHDLMLQKAAYRSGRFCSVR